jgi:hypothetical protein
MVMLPVVPRTSCLKSLLEIVRVILELWPETWVFLCKMLTRWNDLGMVNVAIQISLDPDFFRVQVFCKQNQLWRPGILVRGRGPRTLFLWLKVSRVRKRPLSGQLPISVKFPFVPPLHLQFLATLSCRNSDLLRRGPDGQTQLHSNESNASIFHVSLTCPKKSSAFKFGWWQSQNIIASSAIASGLWHSSPSQRHRSPFSHYNLCSTIAPYNNNHESPC